MPLGPRSTCQIAVRSYPALTLSYVHSMYTGLIHKVGFFVKQNLGSTIQAVEADREQFIFRSI